MQRREETRQSHVQAAEQKSQLEPVDELQRHRHHFLLTGQEDFQQHFRIQREQSIQHEPDAEDHAQGKPEELAGAGEVPGPEIGAYQRRQGVTDGVGHGGPKPCGIVDDSKRSHTV